MGRRLTLIAELVAALANLRPVERESLLAPDDDRCDGRRLPAARHPVAPRAKRDETGASDIRWG
jgi:hypothetical protein